MVKNLHEIYQIKVTLKGIRPPIWRRFLTFSSVKLPEFHNILQVIMGWEDNHLHAFVSDSVIYKIPDPSMGFDYGKDETQVRLTSLLKREGDKLLYEYDFGDGWEHDVVLEKILPFTAGQPLPFCVKGKRACPPEDCGGIWGYRDLLLIMQDPEHEEHQNLSEWLPENFDPEYFSTDDINHIFHG